MKHWIVYTDTVSSFSEELDRLDKEGYEISSTSCDNNKWKAILILKKAKKGKGEHAEPKTTDIIDQIIDLFVSKYKELRGQDYHLPNKGVERSAAGKLLAAHKKKWPEYTLEQTLTSFEDYFASVININDNYIYTNMGLPIIVSKLNAINTIIKNGRKVTGTSKQNPATTDEQFYKAIAEGATTK